MRTFWVSLLTVSALAIAAAQRSNDPAAVAAIDGEPKIVSAAGVTRSDAPLLTLENPSPFDARSQRRLVIVAGLDGDERATAAALEAVRWFKTSAPRSLRQAWTLSALPSAHSARPFHFPPENGFFDDADQPEPRYGWRWVTFQAPDVVLEIHGGDALAWRATGVPGVANSALAAGSLAAAISATGDSSIGGAPAVLATITRESDGAQLLQQVLKAATSIPRSALHARLAARAAREPLAIARVLAARYPQNAIVSYIPSVAWMNTLRLADVTNDASLRDAVRRQTLPWTSGAKPLFGDRPALTAAAGTMIYAELAERGDQAARALAIQGAEAAAAEGANGFAQYGGGWTDDMFMSGAILARSGKMPGRAHDLDVLARRLISYARRLQREDGIFVHFTDGRQAWGRGNGFAALGLAEALDSLPETHSSRAEVLSIYRRQMSALKNMQAPDGTWRQIIDEPGSYREESATAMTLSAMARGVRHGWLDASFRPVIARSWRALAAHITESGEIVDICTSTGSGPTRRYYFDRAAITGADDRGGAMALMAAMEMHALQMR
jgi:rhamnogalacturonyl hydrolase YesR